MICIIIRIIKTNLSQFILLHQIMFLHQASRSDEMASINRPVSLESISEFGSIESIQKSKFSKQIITTHSIIIHFLLAFS